MPSCTILQRPNVHVAPFVWFTVQEWRTKTALAVTILMSKCKKEIRQEKQTNLNCMKYKTWISLNIHFRLRMCSQIGCCTHCCWWRFLHNELAWWVTSLTQSLIEKLANATFSHFLNCQFCGSTVTSFNKTLVNLDFHCKQLQTEGAGAAADKWSVLVSHHKGENNLSWNMEKTSV